MDDARKARPVSGEIMTGAPVEAAPKAVPNAADVVDADYVVIDAVDAAARRSPQASGAAFQSAVPAAGMTALRQAAETSRERTRGGPAFWAVGVTLAVLAFWVSGGHALVRQSVSTVAQAPAKAFSIIGVTSRVDASGVRAVLFVDGQASNDGEIAALLPALSINVTGNDGWVTRYNLGTAGRPLAPGEKFAFSSRLDVPKDGVKTVSVTFAE